MDTNLTRNRAVNYAMGKILQSTDWQEVQNSLANHEEFGPWISAVAPTDEDLLSQSIIREAEGRLGDRLPPNYA